MLLVRFQRFRVRATRPKSEQTENNGHEDGLWKIDKRRLQVQIRMVVVHVMREATFDQSFDTPPFV